MQPREIEAPRRLLRTRRGHATCGRGSTEKPYSSGAIPDASHLAIASPAGPAKSGNDQRRECPSVPLDMKCWMLAWDTPSHSGWTLQRMGGGRGAVCPLWTQAVHIGHQSTDAFGLRHLTKGGLDRFGSCRTLCAQGAKHKPNGPVSKDILFAETPAEGGECRFCLLASGLMQISLDISFTQAWDRKLAKRPRWMLQTRWRRVQTMTS